jgi:hypothetical protein
MAVTCGVGNFWWVGSGEKKMENKVILTKYFLKSNFGKQTAVTLFVPL